ncbi:MAG: hypothetical protein KF805_12740 [Phycisphaeraceae bacterium]|nr:hypothetical protein [Phycisphaeraceae bacterium]
MNFKRYKPGDRPSAISISDMNRRADMLERVAISNGVMPKPGLAGLFGFLGAFGATNAGPTVLWGQLTYRSTGSAALGSSVTYKADSLDGSISITTAETPLFRAFHSSTRIIPAAADSLCLLGWFPDPADNEWKGRIIWVAETNDPGAC